MSSGSSRGGVGKTGNWGGRARQMLGLAGLEGMQLHMQHTGEAEWGGMVDREARHVLISGRLGPSKHQQCLAKGSALQQAASA